MQPNDKQRPSLDGVRQTAMPQPAPRPELRYDHELPAPKAELLLEEGQAKPDLALPDDAGEPKKRRSKKGIIIAIIVTLVIAVLAAVAAAYVWYQQQLSPVSEDTSKHIRVTIAAGTVPSAIAEQLESAGVIRSKLAFSIYTKLTGTQNTLKAGVYSLQPSLPTQEIVKHLVKGEQDTFSIMFLPGDTLANNRKKLIDVGYSEVQVDTAFNKTYDRPLFATKPAGANLEGYIFGDTYEFDASATVEDILNKTFDEYETAVKENDLVNGFKKQGLTLYQGITLASIVQREVTNPTPSRVNDDQRQVARVFLNRMKAGMTLGSDVTYQYAAKILGVAPTPTLDSPYNTRIHTGLPPGPIATPGVGALAAVANPGTNEYLFFLSGDDDVTYFAKTDAEHQQNIVQHCQKKCQIN